MVNGRYWMYFFDRCQDLDSQMGLAYSHDLLHWTEALDHPVVSSRPGTMDARGAEPGPPPIITRRMGSCSFITLPTQTSITLPTQTSCTGQAGLCSMPKIQRRS